MRIISKFIKTLIKALFFVLIAFAPGIPIIQTFLASLSSAGYESEVVFLRFLYLGIAIIAYWRFAKVASWEDKGWIIFLYWQFIVLPFSLFGAYEFEGISIKYFNDLLGAISQFAKMFRGIFAFQIAMQILIVPWTLIAISLLRHIFKSSLNTELKS
jgi:hypothetical protein